MYNKKKKFIFPVAILLIGILLIGCCLEFQLPSLATDSGFDTGGGGGGGSSGGGSSSDGSSGGGSNDPMAFKHIAEGMYALILSIIMIINAESVETSETEKVSLKKKVVFAILILISFGCTIDWAISDPLSLLLMLLCNVISIFGYIVILQIIPPIYGEYSKFYLYMNFDIKKMLDERSPSLENEENLKIAEEAYQIYYDIQNAWMNFDYDKLRTLVTDEMFNMYQAQLQTLELKGQRNVMNNFNPVKKFVVSREKSNGIETIKVLLFVNFRDYIEDKEGNLVSGYKTFDIKVSYLLTYVVAEEKLEKCPGCGVELTGKETECAYCHTKFQTVGTHMRLAKKEVLSQYH